MAELNLEEFLGRLPTTSEKKILTEMLRRKSALHQEMIRQHKEEVSDFLETEPGKVQLEAKALTHLADYFVLMKAASSSLPENLVPMLQPAISSTEFDRKMFRGRDIHNAFDQYLESMSRAVTENMKYATAKSKKRRVQTIRQLQFMQYAMRNVPELKASFKSRKDYAYEQLRRNSNQAHIFLPALDDALIDVTTPTDSLILPHLVMAYNKACAYMITAQKKFLTGKTIIVQSAKDFKEQLELLAENQITTTIEDQTQPHANWLAYAISKVPEIPKLEPVYQS
ncbi:MAG: hypothetical protein U9R08_00865 [Nanoarchaeota archaeon]|nr:hypothetical protein [Nanoarchaeota archaeon]